MLKLGNSQFCHLPVVQRSQFIQEHLLPNKPVQSIRNLISHEFRSKNEDEEFEQNRKSVTPFEILRKDRRKKLPKICPKPLPEIQTIPQTFVELNQTYVLPFGQAPVQVPVQVPIQSQTGGAIYVFISPPVQPFAGSTVGQSFLSPNSSGAPFSAFSAPPSSVTAFPIKSPQGFVEKRIPTPNFENPLDVNEYFMQAGTATNFQSIEANLTPNSRTIEENLFETDFPAASPKKLNFGTGGGGGGLNFAPNSGGKSNFWTGGSGSRRKTPAKSPYKTLVKRSVDYLRKRGNSSSPKETPAKIARFDANKHRENLQGKSTGFIHDGIIARRSKAEMRADALNALMKRQNDQMVK